MYPLLQRRLHDMYQSYYEADPKSRSPPIPTAFLRTPGTRTGDSQASAPWAGQLAGALCAKCMPGWVSLRRRLHRVCMGVVLVTSPLTCIVTA